MIKPTTIECNEEKESLRTLTLDIITTCPDNTGASVTMMNQTNMKIKKFYVCIISQIGFFTSTVKTICFE